MHRLLSVAVAFVVAHLSPGAGVAPVEGKAEPNRLTVAVVQMSIAPTLEGNRDRIVAGIVNAATKRARVVVFPERALTGQGGENESDVKAAVATIRDAARESGIYVVFGGHTYLPALKKSANWMRVFGPDGAELHYYEKLYNNPRAVMPGVFEIDGIRCNAMICADRWLRGVAEVPIQQGARISFELANNYACEWVPSLAWYWYGPRALRNNVWVVLANSGNTVSGVIDPSPVTTHLRHGHSGIIAPDGRIVAAADDDVASMLLAEIDLREATRAEMLARSSHPALRGFWDAGAKLQRGESVPASAFDRLESPAIEITLSIAQVSDDVAKMTAAIGEARARRADVVVFPARAVEEAALASLQAAARANKIAVVFGTEHRVGGEVRNSAFVLGPDGAVLTRYDQLSATSPYQPGTDAASMWFRIKGVPAVVTIGRDALWTELSELAAVVGAQIHVHLDHEPNGSPEAILRQRQVWSNLASFLTFTATANVVGSAIWDDLSSRAESKYAIGEIHQTLNNTPKPDSGPVEVFSTFSANLVVSATADTPLIVATRRVSRTNAHYPLRTSRLNPQMDAWYRIGAGLIYPRFPQMTSK